MGVNLRNELLKASKIHFEAHIEKHRVNVENLLQNSSDIGEHGDVMDTIEKELEDMYTHPDDRDSTEYGEVPQHAEKGSMRPGYYYYPLRNRY